jgi:group II intron reverse transcriptase/maturase/CRISPR-associated endonuclease Cas1
VQIPKPDGGKRDIGIAAIRDRVVQNACLFLLEPIFDPTFSRFSFAFRPRRSAHHALALARSYVSTGRTWAVIADIRKCFDSIDHDLLLNILTRTIADRDLLNLFRHWLEIDVLEFDELLPVIVGVPQGESLSPLLANIYLDPLDKYLEQAGIVFVRYADDIVILTHTEEEAKAALDAMQGFLADTLHLELKPAKTNYAPLRKGIDFLGFTINEEGIRIRRDRLDDVQHLLCGIIKTLGDPASTLAQRVESLTRLNAVVRGWRNYFSLPYEPAIADQLRLADGALEQMAGYYLPHGIRNDPAWICRERLSVVTLPEDGESEQETLHREAVSAGGYPEAQSSVVPGQLMVKGETGRSVRSKKAVPVAVITEEQEGSEDLSMRDGIIEHNGRLYVLVHGVYLSANEDALVIKKKKEEIYRQTLKNLCMVFLQGFGITISVDLQLKLAEADIPVVLAPSVGEQMAVLNPVVTSRSHLRGLQVVRRDDVDVVGTGLRMIAAKMGNQASVLSYFSKYRKKTDPETGERLMRTAGEIRGLATNVIALDPSLAAVRAMAMGLEGHGASLYWRQLNCLMPDNYGFNRRVTKGAQDPINQCLNYMYGMLYGEVWRAVMKTGLDPYFGLMHGSKRDQGSLVFDLIEEFRAPFADRLVMGMLGRGFLPAIGEHGTLKTRTRKQLAICFLKNWSKKISWRSKRLEPTAILLNQTRSVAKLFNREGEYHPYKMKW